MLMLALQAIGIKASGQEEDTHGDDIVFIAIGYKEIDDSDAE